MVLAFELLAIQFFHDLNLQIMHYVNRLAIEINWNE